MTSDDYAWTERWAQENLEGDERDLFLRCLAFNEKIDLKKINYCMVLSLLLAPIAWWMGIAPFSDLLTLPYVLLALTVLLCCCCSDTILNRWLIRKTDGMPDKAELDSFANLRVKSDEALRQAKEANKQKKQEERAQAEEKRRLEERARAELAAAKKAREMQKKKEEKQAKALEERRRRQEEFEARAAAQEQRVAEMKRVVEKARQKGKMAESEKRNKLEGLAEIKKSGALNADPAASSSVAKASPTRIASTVNPKKLNRRNASICPKCGSPDTVLMGSTKKVSVSRAVVGGVMFGPVGAGVGAMTGKKQRHEFLCRSCGARWHA